MVIGPWLISPRCVGRRVFPWRALADNNARLEFIVGDYACPFLVIAQKQDQVGEQRADPALVVELQIVCPIVGRLPSTGDTLAAKQLRLAVFFQFVEAVVEKPLEATLAEPDKDIRLRSACGMQRVADGQLHLDSVRVEGDLAQLLDAVRPRHPIDQTELPQQAIGPGVQALLAISLVVSVLFSPWGTGERDKLGHNHLPRTISAFRPGPPGPISVYSSR